MSKHEFRRLSRLPMQQQWEAAILIAIDCVQGLAGRLNPYVVTLTKEGHWRWSHGDSQRWMIPPRVEARVKLLIERAILTEAKCRRGPCDTEDVVRRLRKWERNGHWRHVIRDVMPRTISERGSDNEARPISGRESQCVRCTTTGGASMRPSHARR